MKRNATKFLSHLFLNFHAAGRLIRQASLLSAFEQPIVRFGHDSEKDRCPQVLHPNKSRFG
jgi:hypothetical protein